MRTNGLPSALRAPARPSTAEARTAVRVARHRVVDLIATGLILLLIPAIMVPELDVHAGAVSISVAPAEAPTGAQITVTGVDFAAGQRVTLVFEPGVQLARLRADRKGSFSVTVVVPADAVPGPHRVDAMSVMSGSKTGRKAGLATAVLASATLLVVALPSSQFPQPTPSASAISSPTLTGTASPASETSQAPSPLATPSASGTQSATATPAPPAPTPVPAGPPLPISSQPSLPVRAAFYYPWFPEAWNQQGMDPFTKYHPSLGFYDSSAPATIQQHIQAMQYGGIQAGISSWWGVGTRSDNRVPTILASTAGSSFRWSLYYEQEAQGDPPVSQIANDLLYIRDHYAVDPSYLKIGGRFVVFVYTDGADACAMATRWSQANAGLNAYIVLKVFSGFKTCAAQPAGWHQYAPAGAADSQSGYSYAISPGFDKANETTARLGRDLTRWAQNVRDMIASGAPFQLVTTVNEWGEGTSVESATEWASASGYGAYLDLLHSNGQ